MSQFLCDLINTEFFLASAFFFRILVIWFPGLRKKKKIYATKKNSVSSCYGAVVCLPLRKPIYIFNVVERY